MAHHTPDTLVREDPTLRDWVIWLGDLILSRAPYVFLVCIIISVPPVLPVIALFGPPPWFWNVYLTLFGTSFVLTIVFMCRPWRGQEPLRRRMRQRVPATSEPPKAPR